MEHIPSGAAEVGLEELDTSAFRLRQQQLESQREVMLADIEQENARLGAPSAFLSEDPASILDPALAEVDDVSEEVDNFFICPELCSMKSAAAAC